MSKSMWKAKSFKLSFWPTTMPGWQEIYHLWSCFLIFKWEIIPWKKSYSLYVVLWEIEWEILFWKTSSPGLSSQELFNKRSFYFFSSFCPAVLLSCRETNIYSMIFSPMSTWWEIKIWKAKLKRFILFKRYLQCSFYLSTLEKIVHLTSEKPCEEITIITPIL
jgi:hypothetical protein